MKISKLIFIFILNFNFHIFCIDKKDNDNSEKSVIIENDKYLEKEYPILLPFAFKIFVDDKFHEAIKEKFSFEEIQELLKIASSIKKTEVTDELTSKEISEYEDRITSFNKDLIKKNLLLLNRYAPIARERIYTHYPDLSKGLIKLKLPKEIVDLMHW